MMTVAMCGLIFASDDNAREELIKGLGLTPYQLVMRTIREIETMLYLSTEIKFP